MELKARARIARRLAQLQQNPFNGIERVKLKLFGVQGAYRDPNPFNGIERLKSLVGLNHLMDTLNPFNGIESHHVLVVLVLLLSSWNPFNGIEREEIAEAIEEVARLYENPFNGIERLGNLAYEDTVTFKESIQWN